MVVDAHCRDLGAGRRPYCFQPGLCPGAFHLPPILNGIAQKNLEGMEVFRPCAGQSADPCVVDPFLFPDSWAGLAFLPPLWQIGPAVSG